MPKREGADGSRRQRRQKECRGPAVRRILRQAGSKYTGDFSISSVASVKREIGVGAARRPVY